MTTTSKGWTPERRAAQRELMLKLKPWEKSTGPKTRRGKARASANAYKHGFYAKAMKEVRKCLRDTSWLLDDVKALEKYVRERKY